VLVTLLRNRLVELLSRFTILAGFFSRTFYSDPILMSASGGCYFPIIGLYSELPATDRRAAVNCVSFCRLKLSAELSDHVACKFESVQAM
jgi:hypothetical protein